MSEELNRPWDLGLNRPVGKDPLERSDSGAFSTGAAGEGPPPPPPDPAWEDAEPQYAGQDEPPTSPIDPEPEGEPRDWEPDPMPPSLTGRRRGGALKKPEPPKMPLSPQQKLLLLDTWKRSGLPARDFGALVNISRHTCTRGRPGLRRRGRPG